MSTTRVLSQPAATALFPEDEQHAVTLHYAALHPEDRTRVEALLGTFVAAPAVTSSYDEWLGHHLATRSQPTLGQISLFEAAESVAADAALAAYLAGETDLEPLEDAGVGTPPTVVRLLVEGYSTRHSTGFVPVRVVEGYENDLLVLQQVQAEVEEILLGVEGKINLDLPGLLSHIVETSTEPLGARTILENLRSLHPTTPLEGVAKVRARSQSTVHKSPRPVAPVSVLELATELGQSFGSLEELTGAKLVSFLRAAFEHTSWERYGSWYTELCDQHGWTVESVPLAILMIHGLGLEPSAENVRRISANATEFYRENISQVTDKDVARRATLLTDPEVALSRLEGIPVRSAQELLTEGASSLEMAAALRHAYRNGASTDDPDLALLMESLDQHVRISLIRTSRDEQDWFFKLLKNTTAGARTARLLNQS